MATLIKQVPFSRRGSMQMIIDRIEGNYFVCELEDKRTTDILISEAPAGAKVGDVLVNASGKFEIDESKTSDRKNRIAELTKDIWE